jgi:hypothetical protein
MGMKPATTERHLRLTSISLSFPSRILKKKQTEQAGGRKERKAKGKSHGAELRRKASKKGPEEPEEQTNNQTQRPKTHGRLTG